MNKNLLIGLGIFLAVTIIGGFLLLGKSKSGGKASMPIPSTGSSNVEEKIVSAPEGEVREIIVSGNEYSFNPASIILKKGENVKLTFSNVGSLSHNLVIDSLGVSTKTIASGKSDTIEFIAKGDGKFAFYCSVGNHRSLGMEGEVTIEQ